jgi:hypothetical protein
MSEKKAAAAQRGDFLDALRREREGYAAAGMTERVAQVDEQIKTYGGQPPAGPSGRRSPRSGQGEA